MKRESLRFSQHSQPSESSEDPVTGAPPAAAVHGGRTSKVRRFSVISKVLVVSDAWASAGVRWRGSREGGASWGRGRACDAGGQTRLSGAHGHRAARVSVIFLFGLGFIGLGVFGLG
ncbi:hypothetical protein ES332_D02G255100v1 [Gossypium tomentosum]|uniref:Uncharacterized protein n=1 Tax=Gossypium tomentosum TaxID=34277 RepID=A0A5D2M1V2_GOSTO|nr:hypothetical protein ES332_D02G255100v1 [Gossypium tomentosum]